MPDLSISSPLVLQDKLAALPHSPGVYLMKDARGRVLYVGKAVSLRARVRSYFQAGAERSPWMAQMLPRIRDCDCIITQSEKEALILEGNLIKMHHPRFNIRFRDDKKFPFLKITVQENFPTLIETRTPKSDKSLYFGPFANAKAMRETVRLVQRLFGLRAGGVVSEIRRSGCPWRDTSRLLPRPCLEFSIKRCCGPCIGAVSREEYAERVRATRLFLEGRQKEVLEHLTAQMQSAAEHLAYEDAARYRDQIRAVQRVLEQQRVVSLRNEEQDILAVEFRGGVAVVGMLIVRDGKLIGERSFTLESVAGRDVEAILDAFLLQHYEAVSHIPRQILLPVPLEDAAVVAEWLSDKRGGVVQLLVPRRGRRRRLLEMARENAAHALHQLFAGDEHERAVLTRALSELQAHLHLPRLPQRIECFDVSSVQGKNAVGCMVVMEEGKPAKKNYRRFHIKSANEAPDDYAMMREVLTRRIRRAQEGDPKFCSLPDLVVVDGGKGHLSCAQEVLRSFALSSVPIAALAKEHELLFVPGRVRPIALPRDSPALHLMQRLRDEAHRFAVEYHRKRRSRWQVHSILDEVPGIGEQRRQNLLKHLGSLKRIRAASLDELAAVPGMTRAVAAKLQEYLSR